MSLVSPRLTAALADRYRIERELGQGGMATVYLAADLKHDRQVAIKVLKPDLAAVLGSERFITEIKTTAALSHPHILPLFDSGEAAGFLFYVMPYIEGETIREKLTRETQFGIDEAVKITTAVADALDYAHRHGVIHRDVKPENILLHDGRPMVMDFGIALAVSAAAGGRMTETGLSLGTPHYMSPEQATADKQITARSDVYSLASVCYEMLAGEPPHSGGSAQAIIMKIVTDVPRPVSELRKSVPSNVVAALARALEKVPADRFESAAAFAAALGNAGYTDLSVAGAGGTGHARGGISPARYWATAALAVVAIAAAAAGWAGRAEPAAMVTRFMITPAGEAAVTVIQADRELAISPDGSHIAYIGNGGTELFVRPMDGLEVIPLLGQDRSPRGPFFSPDGLWLGFFGAVVGANVGSTIWKVPVAGGPALRVAEIDGQRRGGTWGEDGTIVYATSGSGGGLWRVAADGGMPERLTTPDSARGEASHAFPQFLPGARSVLFTIVPVDRGIEAYSVAVLDLESGASKVVVRGGSDARYASSGHLVYGADGSILSVPFDLDRLEAVGTPTRVVEAVATRSGGAAQFDLAGNGTLIYAPSLLDSLPTEAARTLVWVDRQGRESPINAPARAYVVPRLSPDGRRVALEVRDQDHDIWIWNLVGETLERVSFTASDDEGPVWTPDGRFVVYREGTGGVVRKAADGSGTPRILDRQTMRPSSISPDGSLLVASSAARAGSIWMAPVPADSAEAGESGAEPLVIGDGVWLNGEVSPDGRWLAYAGSGSGLFQIFVRPFPGVEAGRWQVTTGGGNKPAWSRDGKELFYLDPSGAFMRVAVDAAGSWKAGAPTKLFDGQYFAGRNGRPYDVSPDGRRFLMIKPAASDLVDPLASAEATAVRATEIGLVVVQRWDTELTRLVPRQ